MSSYIFLPFYWLCLLAWSHMVGIGRNRSQISVCYKAERDISIENLEKDMFQILSRQFDSIPSICVEHFLCTIEAEK